MTYRGLVEPPERIGCRQCCSAWLAGRSVTLQAVGPAAGGVVDARNLDFRVAHAVGNNVGRFWYHQFARAGDAAGGAEFRIFRQQVFDAIEDAVSYTHLRAHET